MTNSVDKIPCTVAMLTFNSASTLDRALSSVRDMREILIADGGSTDETLEIAKRYGAKIILQDPSFKDSSGRLVNYGGARNQLRVHASQPWFSN